MEGETTQENNFFFLFLNFGTLLRIQPKKKNNLLKFDALNEIVSALKFEAARIRFLSDVFVAVTVIVA